MNLRQRVLVYSEAINMKDVLNRPLYRTLSVLAIAFCFMGVCLTSLAQAQSESTTQSAESSVLRGEVKVQANVHSEPRINSSVVRKTAVGEAVTIIGRNERGTWLQINEDEWIPALLIRLSLDSAEDVEPTSALDVTPDVTPEATPVVSATTTLTQAASTTTTATITTSTLISTTEPKPRAMTLGALLNQSTTALADTQSLTNTQTVTPIQTTTVITRLVGVVNRQSNLRAGPSVDFEVVGQADADQEVEILQTDEDESWFEIEPEAWMAAFLVDITGEISITITGTVAVSTTPAITGTDLLTATTTITEPLATATPESEAVDDTSSALTAPDPIPFTRSPAYANRAANLRTGPSTAFDVAGGVAEGEALDITGQNEDGSWYYLEDGNWIAAFLVADSLPTPTSIPTEETPAPTPAEPSEPEPSQPEPETAEPTTTSGNEFVVVSKRLWDVNENGGHLDGPSVHCGYKRELHVHVLDRAGNRMNGAAVQVVYGAKEIMVTGSQGIGDGVASFVLGKGQDVEVVRAPDGREVTSEIARGLVTEPQYIDPEQLKAGRYCTDDASCKAFIDGNSCYAHYSWTVTFQEQ